MNEGSRLHDIGHDGRHPGRLSSAGTPNSGGSQPGSAVALGRQPSAGGTASPKRVSFALQAQPLRGPASAASPSRRRSRPLAPQPAALQLITAADHSLVFIPQVILEPLTNAPAGILPVCCTNSEQC